MRRPPWLFDPRRLMRALAARVTAVCLALDHVVQA
jgi:hypothetical protein